MNGSKGLLRARERTPALGPPEWDRCLVWSVCAVTPLKSLVGR